MHLFITQLLLLLGMTPLNPNPLLGHFWFYNIFVTIEGGIDGSQLEQGF